MSLSVVKYPKAEVIHGTVSMATKSDIPVVRLLIKCFTVERDTLCPSLLSIAPRQN